MSSEAKFVFLMLRLAREAGPASIFICHPSLIAYRTGFPENLVKAALDELETGLWIIREDPLVWIRNGLRYDPNMSLSNGWHKKAILAWLETLPKIDLVAKFRDYYHLPKGLGMAPHKAPHKVRGGIERREEINLGDSPRVEVSSSGESLTGLGEIRGGGVEGEIDPRAAARHGSGLKRSDHASDILSWLNQKTGKNFGGATNTAFVIARLKEGTSPWMLKAMVSHMVRKWKDDPKMRDYLRPKTLFNATNCAQYLGELPKRDEPEQGDLPS